MKVLLEIALQYIHVQFKGCIEPGRSHFMDPGLEFLLHGEQLKRTTALAGLARPADQRSDSSQGHIP